ncbi:MAG: hypothetical protein A2729_01965 [Candidatus Buchananbacteria bacterium RIFCSPHIGHO2_01_FULL_39_14]|uniref:Transcription regulator TrmB N-terminal domain-containing protein n=2 Tax=Candidatus Buchananiibacteriota TaxID=1817903 RepID=A0A1G1YTA4_9BACT|nr:MAG: hypothetical protein A2729_01965 [Candidatus Buchananbacteria bacterium RIFCSPHIGHO2_01_FULL_39_14]OGY48084.1 MAG: hypothetical protein A3D39_02225 [Candidatus Buchananbacteria bacterium RIFCSPHIGHO2_02_FULL_39_17]OGY55578.1 MAG: hypothetical protein A2912_02445 [Candidatus Buchananbacteria bacterium RIFCSPLOWO2_01_FULL_40_23b]
MLENILQKIGLSDKEIKVYLACLKLGPSPVRKVAQVAEINRGTTYDILRALIKLGLVSYLHQDKHQYFIAEDPAKLKDALEQKQEQLEKTKTEIDQIIPQLKSIYNLAGEKPVAKFYDGEAGVKTILQDVLSACGKSGEKQYHVYSSATIKKYLYRVYSNFSKDRISAGIKVKVISIGPGGQTVGLDERKWLSQETGAPTYTIIYAGKIAMIAVDSENHPIGILIEDKNIFQTQKMIFEFIWSKL